MRPIKVDTRIEKKRLTEDGAVLVPHLWIDRSIDVETTQRDLLIITVLIEC